MYSRFSMIALLALLSACVHVPEQLRVEDNTNLTTFTKVVDNGDSTQGQQARWGGVIASVENKAAYTVLEVVHFDLSSSSRPKVKDETQGRFRVIYKGLLDPVIYKEGRSITAIGKVAQNQAGKIGEHEYLFPVIAADYVHLWKEIKQVDVRVTHYPMWHSPYSWYYPRGYYPTYYRPFAGKTPTKAPVKATNKTKQ